LKSEKKSSKRKKKELCAFLKERRVGKGKSLPSKRGRGRGEKMINPGRALKEKKRTDWNDGQCPDQKKIQYCFDLNAEERQVFHRKIKTRVRKKGEEKKTKGQRPRSTHFKKRGRSI